MRWFLSSIGWFMLAMGIATLGYDLVKSLASGSFSLSDTGSIWHAFHSESLQILEPALARHIHPYLWDPIILSLLLSPISLVLAILGFILLMLTRKKSRKSQNDLFVG